MLCMSNPEKHQKKRQVNTKRVVTVVILLLVIFASSVFAFFYTFGRGADENGKSATATTQHGTPVSTRPSIARPLFTSDFSDPDAGWAVGSASGYTRNISNGTLTLANENHTTLTESLPTNLTFDDFSLTMTFTLLQATSGDSVGLYVRGDTNLDHDYRIDFSMDGTYDICKEFLDQQNIPQETFLQPATYTPSLRPPGEPNTITVMMKGPDMVLIINKHTIHPVSDPDYASGQIALFVHNSLASNKVEATFSSVIVYPAPLTLPLAH